MLKEKELLNKRHMNMDVMKYTKQERTSSTRNNLSSARRMGSPRSPVRNRLPLGRMPVQVALMLLWLLLVVVVVVVVLLLQGGQAKGGHELDAVAQSSCVKCAAKSHIRPIFKLRISKSGVWVKQILERRRWIFLVHRLIS